MMGLMALEEGIRELPPLHCSFFTFPYNHACNFAAKKACIYHKPGKVFSPETDHFATLILDIILIFW